MTGATAMSPVDPFLSEEFHQDPASVIARMREEDPVHQIPGIGAWMVTRYDDVRALFTHPDTTNDRRAYQHHRPPEDAMAQWIAANSPFAAPPEQHARMRRLVSVALTPRAVKRMEAQVREVVDQFAAPIRGGRGVVDLFAEFTEPIPNTVIGRITGVPPKGSDELRWRQLGRDAVRGVSPFLTPEERRQSEAAMVEICEYVRELAAERRRQPREDLVSDLVQAHDASDPMTNDEIMLMVAGLVAAGTETATIGGTRGIRTLLQHPEKMKRLRSDPSLLPNAVNELLRFDFGSLGLPRYALREFELRGKNPDRFDVRRDTSRLTIFGHGPHYCLGANLARTELACMFDGVLDFLPPGAHLLEDQIEWVRFGMFSAINSLPVDFGQ